MRPKQNNSPSSHKNRQKTKSTVFIFFFLLKENSMNLMEIFCIYIIVACIYQPFIHTSLYILNIFLALTLITRKAIKEQKKVYVSLEKTVHIETNKRV